MSKSIQTNGCSQPTFPAATQKQTIPFIPLSFLPPLSCFSSVPHVGAWNRRLLSPWGSSTRLGTTCDLGMALLSDMIRSVFQDSPSGFRTENTPPAHQPSLCLSHHPFLPGLLLCSHLVSSHPFLLPCCYSQQRTQSDFLLWFIGYPYHISFNLLAILQGSASYSLLAKSGLPLLLYGL